MNLKEQIRHSIPAAIVVVIGAWVMIYYSIVQWETMKPVPSWDLAIFSELAKAYAHFQTPIVPVKGDGYNLLGDHFHPILILLGPIWRLFPTPLSLLITQDLLLAFSAWPDPPGQPPDESVGGRRAGARLRPVLGDAGGRGGTVP